MLIHEATLQDGMEADAEKKMHTTTGQALQMGITYGVHRTILTHFSPRYQKVADTTIHKCLVGYSYIYSEDFLAYRS